MVKIVSIPIFVISCFLVNSAQAQSIEPLGRLKTTEIAHPKYGLEVGDGWNSFLGMRSGASCVDVMEIPIQTSEYKINYEFIEDNYALSKASGFSAGGSYKGFGFKASASASGSNSSAINRDFLSVLFQAQFNFGSTQAAPVRPPLNLWQDGVGRRNDEDRASLRYGSMIRLTEEANKLISRKPDGKLDLGKFFAICGDSFVLAIHRGVRVNVLATLKSSRQSDKQKFAASISASGFGGTVNASIENSSASEQSSNSVSYQVFQEGGVRPLLDSTNITSQSITDLFKTDRLLDGASSFAATTMPYANLIDLAIEDTDTSQLLLFSDLDKQRSLFFFLQDLAAIHAEIDKAIVLGLPAEQRFYADLAIQSLTGIDNPAIARFRIYRLLRILSSSLDQCYSNPSSCNRDKISIIPKEMTSIENERNATVKRIKQRGVEILADLVEIESNLKKINELNVDKTLFNLWSGESADDLFKDYILSTADLDENGEPPQEIPAELTEQQLKDKSSLIAAGEKINKIKYYLDFQAETLPAYFAPLVGKVNSPTENSEAEQPLKKKTASGPENTSKKRKTENLVCNQETSNRDALSISTEVSSEDMSSKNLINLKMTDLKDTEELPTGNLSIVVLSRLLAVQKGLENSVPCSEIPIDKWVSELYRLAAATPLTQAQVDISALQTAWSGSEVNNEDRKKELGIYLRQKIFAERLYPFRDGLCRTSIADSYCRSNRYLHNVVEDLRLSFDEKWLANPAEVPPAPARTTTSVNIDESYGCNLENVVGCTSAK